LSVVIEKKLSDAYATVDAVTDRNCELLNEGWDQQGFDLIVAIDNGGDSVSGGIDFKHDPRLARDMQVSVALERWKRANIAKGNEVDALHVVFGPCCDGETTEEDMLAAVGKKFELAVASPRAVETEKGDKESESATARALEFSSKFLGEWMIDGAVLRKSAEFCAPLGEKRTPSIMYTAHGIYHACKPEHVIKVPLRTFVTRGKCPCVSMKLLCTAWIFSV
jgi:hypothetical protein